MTRYGQSIQHSEALSQINSLTSKKIKAMEEEETIFFTEVKMMTYSFMATSPSDSWTMWEEMISSRGMEVTITCGEGKAMILFILGLETIMPMVVLVTILFSVQLAMIHCLATSKRKKDMGAMTEYMEAMDRNTCMEVEGTT